MRGKTVALDLASGKQVWCAYHSGPDKDVLIGPDFHAFYAKDRALTLASAPGLRTNGNWVAARSGAGFLTIPELNLIFYGTGNPGVWNADQRPGDNKWSVTIFARDPDTGQAKWAYQVGST